MHTPKTVDGNTTIITIFESSYSIQLQKSTNLKSVKTNLHCPYLVDFLNIASIFGYVPFHVAKASKTNEYHLTSVSFFRKVSDNKFVTLSDVS